MAEVKGHTELPWQAAADQICATMDKRVAVTARRAAETLYETVLTETQDYLRENVEFNLNSELSTLRSTCERLRKEVAERESAVEGLVKALEFYSQLVRYEGPNQRPIENDPYAKPDDAYRRDVTRDGGEIARSALSRFRSLQKGGEND